MPSSLIIGALVVAWIVVLVPMVARNRQEVARTADAALAARIVPRTTRSSGIAGPRNRMEAFAMPDAEIADTEQDADPTPEAEFEDGQFEHAQFEHAQFEDADLAHDEDFVDDESLDTEYFDGEEQFDPPTHELPLPDEYVTRPYRSGRGGYNAEAAEMAAQAKYAMRRKIVLGLLIGVVVTAVVAVVTSAFVWWATAAVALGFVGYLGYLRRQVTIENEIRQRRAARIHAARAAVEETFEEPVDEAPIAPRMTLSPGTMVVDYDDGDPAFDDLDEPDVLPYRRAVGQ